MALTLLLFPDVYSLINYLSFALWLVSGASVAALLYMRYKFPELERPIRVPLVLPIIFLACCIFLVLVPVITTPYDTGKSALYFPFKKKCFKLNLLALEGIGVLIFLSGIPVYVIMKKGSTSPAVKNFSGNETYT